MAREADQITHRQQGAAAGDRLPGRGFQLQKGGGHDVAAGNPLRSPN